MNATNAPSPYGAVAQPSSSEGSRPYSVTTQCSTSYGSTLSSSHRPPNPRHDLRPPNRSVSANPSTRTASGLAGTPLQVSKSYQSPISNTTNHLSQPTLHLVHQPTVYHGPHPDSNLCKDFHWVPYPLGLMPHDSWDRLHNRPDAKWTAPYRCPVCRKPRKATAHMRKIFLVAERLAWDTNAVPIGEREMNERLNWEVNYELGILDPFIEDPEQVPGGKKSQTNKWYPYQNEFETKRALNFIFVAEDITSVSWSLWIGLQMNLQKMFEEEEGTQEPPISRRDPNGKPPPTSLTTSGKIEGVMHIDLTGDDDDAPSHPTNLVPTFGIPTPPSSWGPTSPRKGKQSILSTPSAATQNAFASSHLSAPGPSPIKSMKITSYETLQDFYSLLDQIERTSYVAAMFLEAYAEHLHIDMCRDCWLKRNIDLEADEE